MEKRCTWDNGSLWLKDRPCKIYVGQWPIFHGPLILPYIIVRLKLFLYIKKWHQLGVFVRFLWIFYQNVGLCMYFKRHGAGKKGMAPEEKSMARRHVKTICSHFAYSRFTYDLSHFAYSHFAYSKFFHQSRFAYTSLLINRDCFKREKIIHSYTM